MNVRQIREPSAGRSAFPSPTLPPGPGWKAGQELVGVAASFGIKAQCIGKIFKDVRKIELSRNPNHYDGGSSNSAVRFATTPRPGNTFGERFESASIFKRRLHIKQSF
jgi:hypothetical protein